MSTIVADVYALQAKFGFNQSPLDIDKLHLRGAMMQEELDEYYAALTQGSSMEVVDSLIDLTVFALGTLAIAGVDIQEAWDEVHLANMAKERGTKSTRPDSEGWDLIKPDDWKEPDHGSNTGFIADVIYQARTV